MGKAAAKKAAKRGIFNGTAKLSDFPEDIQKYLLKKVGKMEREITGKSMPTYKEVPCQAIPGKTVLVTEGAEITEGEDGRLYLQGKLIVCEEYRERERAAKAAQARAEKKEREKAVLELKPTVLGE